MKLLAVQKMESEVASIPGWLPEILFHDFKHIAGFLSALLLSYLQPEQRRANRKLNEGEVYER